MSEQIKQAAWSYTKVFLAVILGLFLADGADIFAIDATDLRAWLSAGLASILPVIISALDSSDHRFGRGYIGGIEGGVD